MANSGGRGNDDPERAHRVRSDTARQRATLRYTHWGRPPLPSLLRRETEEYDRVRGRLFSSSSSEASSSHSRSSLPPVKTFGEDGAGDRGGAGATCRGDEKIDTVLYEQGVAWALAFGDKVEEWRSKAIEQEHIYVDLSSSDDDD